MEAHPIPKAPSRGATHPIDGEVGAKITKPSPPRLRASEGDVRLHAQGGHEEVDFRRKSIHAVCFVLVSIGMALGLALGLSSGGSSASTADETSTTTASTIENLAIFDEAVELITANERKMVELPSGETISYREYNVDQPHKLIMLPGYMGDDTSFSVSGHT